MKPADDSEKPLVAVLATVPLLAEGLAAALEDIAEVQKFSAREGDIVGLLRSLRPDAVVVDTEDQAEAAASFAREKQAPLVHVVMREGKLRVLRNGGWDEPGDDGASPEAIRNAVIAGLYGRERDR